MAPYIKSLKLQGILSFAPDSPPIELSPINLIIGANGSGKSNFIDILRFITRMGGDMGERFRELGGQADFFWRGKDSDAQEEKIAHISFENHKSDSITNYQVDFVRDNNDFRLQNEELRISLSGMDAKRFLSFAKTKDKLKNSGESINLTYKMTQEVVEKSHKFQTGRIMPNKWNLLNLPPQLADLTLFSVNGKELPPKQELEYPNFAFDIGIGRPFQYDCFFIQGWEMGRRAELRRPQRTDALVSSLNRDYSNLGLVLNEIKNRNEDLIYEPLKRLVPNFEKLTIDIIGGNIAINIVEKGLSGSTSAFRMSDGTIRFLTILAAIHCQDPPKILAIEDPEIGLHPDAIHCLAELLLEASKTMQIFVTTHSEVLISAFGERLDSVLVCENYLGQGTVLKHLETEVLSVWLEKYSLGEIWRAGEIGGNP